MIHFRFNEKKAIQAVAVLLKLYRKKMNYTKLIKLLYMADRLSLDKFNTTISTDSFYAMDNGPVLSGIYDKIKGDDQSEFWNKYIRKVDYDIELIDDPSDDELSKDEIEILENIYKQFGHMDVWDLVNFCHKYLPEWSDPQGSSKLIPVETVLKQLKKSIHEIKIIANEIDSYNHLQEIFSSK